MKKISIFFISTLIFSTSFAQAKPCSKYQVRFFTSEDCNQCEELYKKIELNHQQQKSNSCGKGVEISARINGKLQAVKVTKIDISDMSRKEQIKKGKKTNYLPEIQILGKNQNKPLFIIKDGLKTPEVLSIMVARATQKTKTQNISGIRKKQ